MRSSSSPRNPIQSLHPPHLCSPAAGAPLLLRYHWLHWTNLRNPFISEAKSTVLEIEKAIEQLPTAQMIEVAQWLDDQRAMFAAAETVFQLLDEEEGEEAGSQWLG